MEKDSLVFDTLPALPQLNPLLPFARDVWQRPDVVALWIGGSIARGNADLYSDVDTVIAVQDGVLETWKQTWVPSLFGETVVGYKAFPLGEQAFLHHLILASGDIYDVVAQSVHADLPKDKILLLGCRDAVVAERLRRIAPEPVPSYPPASKDVVLEVVTDFWFNTHKHRKVLHRGLHLMAQAGIEMERGVLLRLWYVEATGLDCGSMRSQTIFGMTQVMRTVEQAKGAEGIAILGASLTDRAAICHAIEQLREEAARVGRTLAASLDFSYPYELEAVAHRGWQEFMSDVT